MESFRELLLDIWREACRHIEVAQSAHTIARILVHRLPIDRLVVLAFDWKTQSVRTRAVSLSHHERHDDDASRLLNAGDRKRLQAWLRDCQALHHRPGDTSDDVISIMLPASPADHWLAVPLSTEHGQAGALLLRAQPPSEFTDEHCRMAELLIEPFTAVLENDSRLHELRALREAAEADKRSALSRLGRDDLTDTIIGGNRGLKPVMDRVRLLARSDIPVLILGETGSGKEVIARAIHDQSPRAKGPFIRVNCGAIASELIDSELFGHEKGAFTGATALRRGWFERADEGTLLLDEIGELPLAAQVRLLRVLQEGVFDRVGGEKPVRVNVRIVAATHRDLPAMVQNGKFREDLWYRISSFPILLPPLRERREDIPELAKHFAGRAARRFGLRLQSPRPDDIALLTAYSWPGNIRELASVIDRAAILGDGNSLEITKALGVEPRGDAGHVGRPGGVDDQAARSPVTSLDDAMRRHIESVLSATRGRIEGERGAARLLKINPHTLRARMRKLKIEWAGFRSDHSWPPGGGNSPHMRD